MRLCLGNQWDNFIPIICSCPKLGVPPIRRAAGFKIDYSWSMWVRISPAYIALYLHAMFLQITPRLPSQINCVFSGLSQRVLGQSSSGGDDGLCGCSVNMKLGIIYMLMSRNSQRNLAHVGGVENTQKRS